MNKLGRVALGDAITLWILFYAFPIKAYVKHVAPRMGPFWQNGHNFNKPGGGVYLMMQIPIIKAVCQVVPDKKICYVYLI